MEILRTLPALAAWRDAHRGAGRTIAFVPTMGFLHEGHLALVTRARALAEVSLVSIFVNPTQFGPNEDLARYPRDEVGDLEKCRGAGADAVYLPDVPTMYGDGHVTRVQVSTLTEPLCGASRPGHFDGVCTIVLKLFNQTGCQVAVFGEKDFQQLAVVRRMTRDLDVPVRIVGHPIVRERDGLAMSSRNVYLSPGQRAAATSLSQALGRVKAEFGAGERRPDVLAEVARRLLESVPEAAVEYVDVRDADSLATVDGPATAPLVVALAVRFGATRLIDNCVLTPG